MLVQWKRLSPEEATWEDEDEMRTSWPSPILEDKVVEGDGNDTYSLDSKHATEPGIRNEQLNTKKEWPKRMKQKPSWLKGFI